jgi:hypothetical protein
LNNINPIGLTFDVNGSVNIQLPAGPIYDSYKLYIFVQIYDDFGAIAVYNISNSITVRINASLTESIVKNILSPVSSVVSSIIASDLKSSANQILTIVSMINQNHATVNDNVINLTDLDFF